MLALLQTQNTKNQMLFHQRCKNEELNSPYLVALNDPNSESKVRSHSTYQKFENKPQQAVFLLGLAQTTIGHRFCEALLRQKFFIFTDVHSKWIEVHIIASATSRVTI